MSEQVDLLVIGAGPAGLAAATLAAERGASVLLADEQPAPGGQIYRGIEAVDPAALPMLGPDYAYGRTLVERFRASGVDYRPRSAVWQLTPERDVWISRDGRSGCVQAGQVIIATGAMERPVPVPGWTLPGVMTMGALQILLKTSALRVDEPLVLAGSGPLFYLLAEQCIRAGANLIALLDTTAWRNEAAALRHLPGAMGGMGRSYLGKGLALKRVIERAKVPIHRFVREIRIEGDHDVCEVAFHGNGLDRRVQTRLVGLHEGVIPAQQMARSVGCDFVWDARQFCFRPTLDAWGMASVDGVFIAGDGAGIAGARAAEHGGRLAALAALARIGRLETSRRDALAAPERAALADHLRVRPFLETLYAPRAEIRRPADDVTICRCEEVTAGQLRGAVAEGCLGPNQAKAYLRCGMGPCQGRLCGPVVSEVIAEARKVAVAEAGYYRIRPPLKPVTVGELAAIET